MKICLNCGHLFRREDWQCPKCGHLPEMHDGYPFFAPQLVDAYGGFEAQFFHRLARMEKGHFWFESRNRVVIWALRRYFTNARNFLEIGCGTGFVLCGIHQEFPKLLLHGSDIFVEGLMYAKKRSPEAYFLQTDAYNIPFEDEFDVIGAFDVLEHIQDDEAVLRQMYTAVRQYGGIILTVPQHPFLWSAVDEYSCHIRRYQARELKAKVEHGGFKVLRMTSFVSILLPLMIASRLKRRKPNLEFDPTSELKINSLMNRILERVLDLERWMIRLGLSFPVGGSLLLIARKVPNYGS